MAEPREIVRRIDVVRDRVRRACARAGRAEDEVEILAVSKRHDVDAIRAAYSAGQRSFGENYVQELAGKAGALTDLPELRWRFIGHLQRNKVEDIVRLQASIDTLDSVRLADAIEHRAARADIVVHTLIQVNVAAEPQKSGCLPDALPALLEKVAAMEHVRVQGLMTVPPAVDEPEASRVWFRRLRVLAEAHGLHTLSMGMSADIEVAVEEGATRIRVGTAIFGARA